MHGRAIPLLIIAALVVLAVLRTALAWNELPDVMASHFGPSGRPDGWQGKAAFVITFGGIAGFTIGLLLAIGKLLQRVPAGAINVPHREYWLTPERRPEAMARLTASMDWLAVSMTALLAAVLELVLRANLARQPLDNVRMLSLLAAFLVFQIGWLIHLWRR